MVTTLLEMEKYLVRNKYIFILHIIQHNCFISGGATIIFDIVLKSSIDGFKDEMIDVGISKEGNIDEEGLLESLISVLKTHFMKNRRGSFILNGEKYKV